MSTSEKFLDSLFSGEAEELLEAKKKAVQGKIDALETELDTIDKRIKKIGAMKEKMKELSKIIDKDDLSEIIEMASDVGKEAAKPAKAAPRSTGDGEKQTIRDQIKELWGQGYDKKAITETIVKDRGHSRGAFGGDWKKLEDDGWFIANPQGAAASKQKAAEPEEEEEKEEEEEEEEEPKPKKKK